MSRKKAPSPAVLDKEIKIIELRRAGVTWEKIAKEVGFKNASGAYKMYQRAAERMVRPHLEEYRDMQLDRLERMHMAVWPRAKDGDLRAIDTALRIADREANLLNLNAPIKVQAEVTVYEGQQLVEHTARIIELIRQSRGEAGNMGSNTGETRAITN
jgi:transcriptional regulator